MSPLATRRLLSLHRICGLIVALNMVVFSVTGAILIFHHEIDSLLGTVPELQTTGDRLPLGKLVDNARSADPTANPLYVFQDDEEYPGFVVVGMAHGSHQIDDSKPVFVDARSGEVRSQVDLLNTFTAIVLRIHAQLLLGPLGALLVGLIGLALLVMLLSGVVLYGAMMKRFVFGLVRRDRHLRTLLADVHKLLGVASFGWTLVVVATGVLLSIGSQLIQFYTLTELATLAGPHKNAAPVSDFSTLDAATEAAERASQGRRWSFAALPGSNFASPRHYAVLLKGHEGLDQRMLTIALVDAVDVGQVEHREFPWYLQLLMLSEPLHFGDYGGLPLKLLWLAFTLVTLAMTGSGVWVTWSTRRDRRVRQRAEVLGAAASELEHAEPAE